LVKTFFREVRLVFWLARDVCRAAIKERMMYGFLLIALLFILMANVPFFVDDPKTFGHQAPEVSALQIGFVGINIFTLLIAVFVSMNTLQSFFRKEGLVLLLSKPVRRWQIVQGATWGLFEMVFLNWFLLTMGLWLVMISQTHAFSLNVWPGMAPTLLLGLVTVSLVVFFFMVTPNALAGVLAILFVIAGFGSTLAQETFARSASPGAIKFFLILGVNILPQVNGLFGISMDALGLFNLKISPGPILRQTFLLAVVLQALAAWKFKRLCRF
jgi:ABC-type transport system involved in multi-copper enzyme maturation permease subunit